MSEGIVCGNFVELTREAPWYREIPDGLVHRLYLESIKGILYLISLPGGINERREFGDSSALSCKW